MIFLVPITFVFFSRAGNESLKSSSLDAPEGHISDRGCHLVVIFNTYRPTWLKRFTAANSLYLTFLSSVLRVLECSRMILYFLENLAVVFWRHFASGLSLSQ